MYSILPYCCPESLVLVVSLNIHFDMLMRVSVVALLPTLSAQRAQSPLISSPTIALPNTEVELRCRCLGSMNGLNLP
jgi:hypothetical protein